jgi:hypothetical protein
MGSPRVWTAQPISAKPQAHVLRGKLGEIKSFEQLVHPERISVVFAVKDCPLLLLLLLSSPPWLLPLQLNCEPLLSQMISAAAASTTSNDRFMQSAEFRP